MPITDVKGTLAAQLHGGSIHIIGDVGGTLSIVSHKDGSTAPEDLGAIPIVVYDPDSSEFTLLRAGTMGQIPTYAQIHGTVDLYSDIIVGTVNIQTGTIGEIRNIIGGTLGRINDIAGTVEISNITNITGGTIGQITNIIGGTLGRINDVAGTVEVSAMQGTVFVNNALLNCNDAGPYWSSIKKFKQAVQPEGTIWTPTSTTALTVTDLIISAQAAGTIELRLSTVGTLLILAAAANGGLVTNLRTPFPIGSPDAELTYYCSGGTFNITTLGYEL